MSLVSIVIVNWNGSKDTLECVKSLDKINYRNYETIIVDNGSSDYERKILVDALGDKCTIIELKKNLGFALANNVGIMLAIQRHAEFILLLNNDTVVEGMFLDEMLLSMHKDPSVGIGGCKVLLYDDRDRIWYAGGKLNMYIRHKTEGLYQIDKGQFNVEKGTDFVAGACMLIRTSIFEKTGLLPKEYFLGWEDIDFCFRARNIGFKCWYSPSAKIWHKASSSYKRHSWSYLQVFLGFRNRVIMRYKYLSKRKFILFLGLQLFFVIPVHVLYYIAVYKDLHRVKNLFKGLMCGLSDMKERRIMYKI